MAGSPKTQQNLDGLEQKLLFCGHSLSFVVPLSVPLIGPSCLELVTPGLLLNHFKWVEVWHQHTLIYVSFTVQGSFLSSKGSWRFEPCRSGKSSSTRLWFSPRWLLPGRNHGKSLFPAWNAWGPTYISEIVLLMALLSLLARRTRQTFGSDCLQAEQDLVRDDDSYLTRMAIDCQGPREILPFEGVSDGTAVTTVDQRVMSSNLEP